MKEDKEWIKNTFSCSSVLSKSTKLMDFANFRAFFFRRIFLISIKEAIMERGDKNYSSCAFQAKSLLNL